MSNFYKYLSLALAVLLLVVVGTQFINAQILPSSTSGYSAETLRAIRAAFSRNVVPDDPNANNQGSTPTNPSADTSPQGTLCGLNGGLTNFTCKGVWPTGSQGGPACPTGYTQAGWSSPFLIGSIALPNTTFTCVKD